MTTSEQLMRQMGLNSEFKTAVYTANLEDIKDCLSRGANINYAPQDANMLMMAVNNKQWEVVDLLLELGADPNHKNRFGFTILHEIAAEAPEDVAIKIFDLAQEWPTINWKDEFRGMSPFMTALFKGRDELVNKLLDNPGIDINSVNSSGQNALHVAALLGKPDLATSLVEKGVKMCLDNDNKSPLEYADDNFILLIGDLADVWHKEANELKNKNITPTTVPENIELNKKEGNQEPVSSAEPAPVNNNKLGISSIKKRG